MYDLTDIASYQAYFEELATKHKLINGFLYGDHDVQANEVRSWQGRKLWLWPYGPVKVEDNRSDNYLQLKEGSMFIGGAAANTKFSVEDSYYQECEQIAKDIISRILKDRSERKVVTRLNGFKYNRSELMLSTKFLGCELSIWFYDPTGFEYDVEKWNP